MDLDSPKKSKQNRRTMNSFSSTNKTLKIYRKENNKKNKNKKKMIISKRVIISQPIIK